MQVHEFEAKQRIARPIEEVFAFFADARNLERITPPWLRFAILTPQPIAMAPGALIDYRLRVHGTPMRWRSEITAWEPPHRFMDVQRRGPYRLWEHEHGFEAMDGATLVRDCVRYAVPGGALVNRFLVKRDIESIFAHRRAALERLLAGEMQ